MEIRRAVPEEYGEVRAFYHEITDMLEGTTNFPGWKKDIYPSPEALHSALDLGELYIGTEDGRIAAGMVVNRECNEDYALAEWKMPLAYGEYMVLHMLGVHPDYAGCGRAKQMVRFALDIAGKAGMRAMRLDVLKGNVPAAKLYTGIGFTYAGTIQMYYEDTGRTAYEMYEYAL